MVESLQVQYGQKTNKEASHILIYRLQNSKQTTNKADYPFA